jgi:hypothetical protein
MVFGVIACNASNVMIALLVGSAIAWKISRLMLFKFFVCAAIRLQIYVQPFGFANFFFNSKESQLERLLFENTFQILQTGIHLFCKIFFKHGYLYVKRKIHFTGISQISFGLING